MLPKDAVEQAAKGITLTDGTPTLPARLELKRRLEQGAECLLTIHEGKFHQVKRMFEAMGCEVVYLKRLSMGPLVLDETLAPGEYRELRESELDALAKA